MFPTIGSCLKNVNTTGKKSLNAEENERQYKNESSESEFCGMDHSPEKV